jgi:NAD(P)-dependent dehydrogenase (short-subunit alcohol dehydrogenase family)
MTSVFITGASRGIGLALAEAYAGAGARVYATCRDPARAGELRRLAESAADVTVLRLDVTNAAQVAGAAAALEGAPLDILINNAGVISPDRQSSLDMDFEGWEYAFAVNTMGPLRVAQALLPDLRAARGARIVTISSRMGSSTSASGHNLAYRSTKAAVNRVMQGLASDLRRDGVSVVVVHPGWVRTAMGGRGAPTSPGRSAAAIVSLIDRLSPRDSGRFLETDGSAIPW